MKFIVGTIVCFLTSMSCHYCIAASCLENKYFTHSSGVFYDAGGFINCLDQNQCKPAVKILSKIEKDDPIIFAYLKGTALANGDCFKKNSKEAEKFLLLAAKYNLAFTDSFFQFCVAHNIYKKLYYDEAMKFFDMGLYQAGYYISGYVDNTFSNDAVKAGIEYMICSVVYHLAEHELTLEKVKNNKARFEFVNNIYHSSLHALWEARFNFEKFANQEIMMKFHIILKEIADTVIKNQIFLSGPYHKISLMYQPNNKAVTDGKPVNFSNVSKRKKAVTQPISQQNIQELMQFLEELRK